MPVCVATCTYLSDSHMECILFPQGAVMIARYMKLQRGNALHSKTESMYIIPKVCSL